MYCVGGIQHKGYSGRANSWYFSRTTSTNAWTPSRSANSIQQCRTPSNTVPSRTACLMTRGKPLVEHRPYLFNGCLAGVRGRSQLRKANYFGDELADAEEATPAP